MSLLNYASGRIESVLFTIKQLKGSEFPYSDSKDALNKIEELFEGILSNLKSLEDKANPDFVKQLCALSLRSLFRCLPLLGFILRSTNVRNAFEVFGPLLDVSKKALEPEIEAGKQTTKLLLSSEWGYSPITYPEIPYLPGFVLIGFPAPESSNPLLAPLSGHELGHSVWTKHGLRQHFSPKIQEKILAYIRAHWKEYNAIFPSVVSPKQLDINLFARQTWLLSLQWALKQAEESFCDFLGLFIYGTSFLQAFAYLFAPNVLSPRSVNYPDSMTRVRNLLRAASSYKYDVPRDFDDMFQSRPQPQLAPADKFRLSVADSSLYEIVDSLINKAEEIISSSEVPKPNHDEIKRIYERYKIIVPAKECKSLSDILNAAWKAYEDPELWRSTIDVAKEKDRILKDLVLKNIEIFYVEQILRNAR